MIVLRLAVFFMAMVTFAGSLVLVVLSAPIGLDNATGVIGAAAVGTVISIPVTYFVSKAMAGKMG